MKNYLIILFAMFLFLPTAQYLLASEAADLTGDYELTGVMEMAGGLSLKKNNTYLAGFSYGAADWVETGDWQATSNGLVLKNAKFKMKNSNEIPLFLPSGTTFTYQDGKLTTILDGRKISFIDPNKTPSNRGKTGKPGEGRMIVKGKVLSRDQEVLMVKMEECMLFSVPTLSPEVLKAAEVGKVIDVEIPFSSILGSQSCPE